MQARPAAASGEPRARPSGRRARRPRKRSLRLGLLAVVLIVAAAIGLVARDVTLVKRAELATVDARFSVRGRARPPKNVVVVGIDGATLGAIGRPWPFPRRFHAMLLNRLHASGAAAIVYDVTFSDGTNAVDDQALLAAVRRAAPITLAVVRATARGEPVIVGGARRVQQLGARLGVAGGYAQDPGGELRRIRYAVDGVKTLPVVSAEMVIGHRLSQTGFGRDGGWIDFRGPPRTFRTYSFSDVLAGRVPASAFRGKVVLVGATSPTLQDVHATPPSGQLMSGVEIEANATATALGGMPLRSAVGWVDV